MIRPFSLFALGIMLVSGCAVSPANPGEPERRYTPIQFEGQTASASERSRCEAVGGEVKRVGLAGFEACVQTLPDAGQSCAGETDCLARCVLDGSDHHLDFGDKVPGICEATDSPFGCTALVENGEYVGTLCVD